MIGRLIQVCLLVAALAPIAAALAAASPALYSARRSPAPYGAGQITLPDRELVSRARLFAEIGPGAVALKSRVVGPPPAGGANAERRYYVLLPSRGGAGASLLVFTADGKRVAQLPAPVPGSAPKPVTPAAPASPSGKSRGTNNPDLESSLTPSLAYGHDFDVDAAGRVYVADRAANAVKIFDASGAPVGEISIPLPTSVAALASGEVAVTSLKSYKLITVFAQRPDPVSRGLVWRVVREFADPTEVTAPGEAGAGEFNRYLNIGRLSAGPEDSIVYTFSYLPEPTVREYDRFGYLKLEIELTTLEFQSSAQAVRRSLERLRQSRFNLNPSAPPPIKQSVTAVGVDPETQELWVALGAQLLHFDRDGVRKGTYRMFTAEGPRVEASAILVEPNRLIVASEALGIFEFPRPDKSK